ncbi:hypothetical protein P153DRAFT_98064 [Dothidotthia symphoricarpi CBS 119687]|uniref:Uncharacterized protein n=1 Tax=Dothidotthia symphoricarpi CBS 119687 TaxID=1392245 RepID=A0A6A6ARY5_9PLEO|nr:uncharacterized protein P153DRAFT_98064 [Dothidotthia symphoricarpi CBS 119687]KAF2133755.1 hypothetical protein P153DRAFT_98064 [Dothidotthia symphoricarpi CBS 119687]
MVIAFDASACRASRPGIRRMKPYAYQYSSLFIGQLFITIFLNRTTRHHPFSPHQHKPTPYNSSERYSMCPFPVHH